jgi:sugar (pentulose or hexulose) kinase
MEPISVIAIFDIGKTNKKLLLFDEQYKLVCETVSQFAELTDEDGFACEDVEALSNWIKASLKTLLSNSRFLVKAINFSAYGASFVYLDIKRKVIPPLYNYLKPYPTALSKKFYLDHGGEQKISKETASPILGNLNAGMQLYRIKNQLPDKYQKIETALNLPQFLSYVLTGNLFCDYTSIGCHTQLWDFNKNNYHDWVLEEGIDLKLAPIKQCDSLGGYFQDTIPVGIGMHDSSASLIPYLISFTQPFILISTGTWSISLNPFNHTELTDDELKQDCLCFISYKGNPVKASRLFAGYEHEQETKRLAVHFSKQKDYFQTVTYDANLLKRIKLQLGSKQSVKDSAMVGASGFSERNLADFASYEEAYHQLIADIIVQQVKSTNLILNGSPVKKIFVDGGFSKNPIYMHLLSEYYDDKEVYAASIPQASALGAALAVHEIWNKQIVPHDLINLKFHSTNKGYKK